MAYTSNAVAVLVSTIAVAYRVKGRPDLFTYLAGARLFTLQGFIVKILPRKKKRKI
jgi:hypothetical protein